MYIYVIYICYIYIVLLYICLNAQQCAGPNRRPTRAPAQTILYRRGNCCSRHGEPAEVVVPKVRPCAPPIGEDVDRRLDQRAHEQLLRVRARLDPHAGREQLHTPVVPKDNINTMNVNLHSFISKKIPKRTIAQH